MKPDVIVAEYRYRFNVEHDLRNSTPEGGEVAQRVVMSACFTVGTKTGGWGRLGGHQPRPVYGEILFQGNKVKVEQNTQNCTTSVLAWDNHTHTAVILAHVTEHPLLCCSLNSAVFIPVLQNF